MVDNISRITSPLRKTKEEDLMGALNALTTKSIQAAPSVASSALNELVDPSRTLGTGLGLSISNILDSLRSKQQSNSLTDQTNLNLQRIKQLRESGKIEEAKKLAQQNLQMATQEAGRIRGTQEELQKISDVGKQQIVGGAIGTGSQLLSAGMSPSSLLKSAAISGGISGAAAALTGQDISEAVGKGIGATPKLMGFNRLTTPMLAPITNSVVGKTALGKLSSKFLSGGIANLTQDEVYTRLADQRVPGAGERVTSFLIGGLTNTLSKGEPDNALFRIKNGEVKIDLDAFKTVGPTLKKEFGFSDNEIKQIHNIVKFWNEPIKRTYSSPDGLHDITETIPRWRAKLEEQPVGLSIKQVSPEERVRLKALSGKETPEVSVKSEEKIVEPITQNKKLNLEYTDLTPDQKQVVREMETTLNEKKTVISHEDIIKAAKEKAPQTDVMSQEQQLNLEAQAQANREAFTTTIKNFDDLRKSGASEADLTRQFENMRKSYEVVYSDKEFAGRLLNAKKIMASQATPMEKVMSAFESAKVDPETYKADFLKTNWEDPEAVSGLYNKYIPKDFNQKLGDILSVPRALMASFDMSAPFRQAGFLVGSKEWFQSWRPMVRSFFGKDAYNESMKVIRENPNYQSMVDHKLALTDVEVFSPKEEAYMSQLSEKIPGLGLGVKASDRAYTSFLNTLRSNTYDSFVKQAEGLGLQGKELSDFLDSAASYINAATGRGTLPGKFNQASGALSTALFSPRLIASRLSLLNPVYYMKLDPAVRSRALGDLFRFGTIAATTLGLAKMAGAEVETDPRNANWGKVKIGNTRVDMTAGFGAYIRLASQLSTGKLISSSSGKEYDLYGGGKFGLSAKKVIQNFIESKEAPLASFLTGLITQETASGKEFNLPAEVINRMVPLMVQDVYDNYKEWGISGLAFAVPSFFGLSTQTYGKKIPTIQVSEGGKASLKLLDVPNMSEDIINKLTGKKISNIPESKWESISNAELQRQKLEAQKENAKAKLKAGSQVQSGIGDAYLTDVDQLPAENEWNRIAKNKKYLAKYETIVDDPSIPNEMKVEIVNAISQRTGMSANNLGYYYYSTKPVDEKTAYVVDKITKMDKPEQMIAYLVAGRNEILGKKLVSDEVLTALVDNGIISQSDAKYLKNIDSVGGKLKTKKTGSGTAKRMQINLPKSRLKTKTGTYKPLKFKLKAIK